MPTPPGPSPFPTPPIPIPTPEPGGKLTDQQIRQLERQKRQMIRELKEMERFYTRSKKKTETLSKIAALRKDIDAFKPVDNSAFETLQSLQEDLEDLRQDFQDDIGDGGGINEEEQLRQMKRSIRSFESYLNALESKIKRVERGGIKAPETIKDAIVKAREMVKRVKAAKEFADIEADIQNMAEIGETLNDALPILEQLSRLPQAITIMTRQIGEADRLVKQAKATIKRLKIDASEPLAEMDSLLAEMRQALTAVKTASVETDDLHDYIETNCSDKLETIRNVANQLRATANVRQHVGTVTANIRRYGERIKRLERAGESMADAYELLEELKSTLEELRPLATQRLSEETADQIIAYLRTTSDLAAELEERLHLQIQDTLEQQLQRLFESGGEKFDEFDLELPATARPASAVQPG